MTEAIDIGLQAWSLDPRTEGEACHALALVAMKEMAETHLCHYIGAAVYNVLLALRAIMSDDDMAVLALTTSVDDKNPTIHQAVFWSVAAVDEQNPQAHVPVMTVTQSYDVGFDYFHFSTEDDLREFTTLLNDWFNRQVKAHRAECVQGLILHEINKVIFQLGFHLVSYTFPTEDHTEPAVVCFQKLDVKLEIVMYYKALAMSIKEMIAAIEAAQARQTTMH